MSGHNKWSSIKHKKAATDSKRGKIFTKIIREITVAAKAGGGDIDSNPNLRLAVSKAKAANMPADNISRAIKKGTGELEGVTYEEALYEGYGPGGVGILVQVLTDNKNRSASDIRAVFTRKGGSLASQGAVSYQFQRKGFFEISKDAVSEDDLFMLVTDAGAEDLKSDEENFEVITELSAFEDVRKALENADIECSRSETAQLPDTLIAVAEVETAKKLLNMIDALEDNDDVQNVYDNSDIPQNILEQLE